MQRYMKAMSNGGMIQAREGEILDNYALHAAVPSLFADTAHESRTNRFVPIPTIDVINGLRREGFQPVFAQQARTRVAGKADYTRHLIRLRHASLKADNGDVPEIIITNANDGTSSYNLMAGFFRFLCMNGLFVGDMFETVRVRHTGNAVADVIEGTYSVLDNVPKVLDSVETFKGIALDQSERHAFARLAHMVRFPDAWEPDETGRPQLDESKVPVTPERLLEARRSGDRGGDLWRTFNVIQENTLRGGQRGIIQGTKGQTRRAKVREVTGIDQKAKMNRALWTLADEMAAMKA